MHFKSVHLLNNANSENIIEMNTPINLLEKNLYNMSVANIFNQILSLLNNHRHDINLQYLDI